MTEPADWTCPRCGNVQTDEALNDAATLNVCEVCGHVEGDSND